MIEVYTDACSHVLGGFYYSSQKFFWNQTILILEQNKAFIIPTSSSSHIYVYELEGLIVEFDI